MFADIDQSRAKSHIEIGVGELQPRPPAVQLLPPNSAWLRDCTSLTTCFGGLLRRARTCISSIWPLPATILAASTPSMRQILSLNYKMVHDCPAYRQPERSIGITRLILACSRYQ